MLKFFYRNVTPYLGKQGNACLKPLFIISGLLLILMAGCAPEPQQHLRIATNQWIGYEPLYLARELGYIDPAVFQLIEMPDASAVINAFRNHAVDVAALTLDEALMLQHDGMDMRILVIMDISNGADVLIANPNIKNLAGLKGKRIGLESGALGAYMLSRSLNVAGIAPEDVVVIPVTVDKHVPAYDSGNVDALVTFEPMRTQLLKKGAIVLFDSSKIPNEIVDVLVVDAGVYNKRQQQLHQLVQTWFKAVSYIGKYPEDAAKRMAPRIDLTSNEFLAVMNDIHWGEKSLNRQLLLGERPALLISAQKMADIMLKSRLISHPVNPRLLIDPVHTELLQ